MNRKTIAALTAAGALAVLTACGPSHSAGPAVQAAPAAATKTASGPSVAQVASVVAKQKATIDKLSKDIAHFCTSSATLADQTCSILVQTAPTDGQIGSKALAAVTPVPAEIQSLTSATLQSFNQLAQVSSAHCEKDPDAISCLGDIASAQGALTNLEQQLAAWQPYM